MDKKFYLTKQGLQHLKKEYEDLKNLRFAKTQSEFPKTMDSEDVNAEYLSFQEDLDLLETRINELEFILKNVELIGCPQKQEQDIVCLGAHVKVEINGEPDEFQIVGTLEANPTLGKISNESPVGEAILGRKKGEMVALNTATKVNYKILDIKYGK